MITIKPVLLSFLIVFPLFASAIEPDTSAPIERQKCGKNISLTVQDVDSGHAVIGLINHKTKSWDYFYSQHGFINYRKYSQYVPVWYDAKANKYELIKQTSPTSTNIFWGADKSGNYLLSLGGHNYRCGALSAPEANSRSTNENLNAVYGE